MRCVVLRQAFALKEIEMDFAIPGMLDQDFAQRVASNQAALSRQLNDSFDFIVCGAGSSGAVVARRLAEDTAVSVLLLEAGGSDEVPAVTEALRWPENLGSERDWNYRDRPNPNLNGRSIPLSMGKVLGGGSSINVMVWARGHKNDWDFFASESGSEAWNYRAILDVYRNIEDWQGPPDNARRGSGGLVAVRSAADPSPLALATLAAAEAVGIPKFESQNGEMMEGEGGCAVTELRMHDGRRLSIFRSYVYPMMDRPNLTVMPDAMISRILFDGKSATGVEVTVAGATRRFTAKQEIILSCGAINTPKLLMQSGIGDREELERHGIPVIHHLQGVGRNMQDHQAFGCIWEYREPLAPRNGGSEAKVYWKTDPALDTPDVLLCQAEFPVPSMETAPIGTPEHGWTMFAGLARPKSRGRIRLSGSGAGDAVDIDAGFLSHPDDLLAAQRCVALTRDIGNAAPLSHLIKREAMPGTLSREAMRDFLRNSAVTFWHQSGTAKMGVDDTAVVDGSLKVRGIRGLRIADASVMPRVMTGNTMAGCVVIGEQAARFIAREHGLKKAV
jgi:choline dehydrogenase